MIAFFTNESKIYISFELSFFWVQDHIFHCNPTCFYCKAVFRENHRISLYSYILMMKAFSKVYSSWKITIFPALEGNIMFSVCFTDWFFISVFSVCICVYVVFFFFSFLCIMAHEQILMNVNKCLSLVHISASTPLAASSVSVHQDNIC